MENIINALVSYNIMSTGVHFGSEYFGVSFAYGRNSYVLAWDRGAYIMKGPDLYVTLDNVMDFIQYVYSG